MCVVHECYIYNGAASTSRVSTIKGSNVLKFIEKRSGLPELSIISWVSVGGWGEGRLKNKVHAGSMCPLMPPVHLLHPVHNLQLSKLNNDIEVHCLHWLVN